MLYRKFIAVLLGTVLCSGGLSADDYTLATSNELPEGVSAAIGQQLTGAGLAITGPKRGYANFWLVKSAAVAADFEATSSVKYPFTPGQLVGVLTIPKRAGFQDFRGNELESGTYTLRYGRQPVDGNHIGTSDLADFLVVIPAEKDESAGVIGDPQQIAELSAAASGTTHPAILSLQPVDKAGEKAALTHDEDREFWILNTSVQVQQGDQTSSLPLRLIVVGVSEG